MYLLYFFLVKMEYPPLSLLLPLESVLSDFLVPFAMNSAFPSFHPKMISIFGGMVQFGGGRIKTDRFF